MRERERVDALIARIVEQSGTTDPRARDELRRELASHFESAGDSPEALRAAVERFGAPEEIGAEFRRTYLPSVVASGRRASRVEHLVRDVRHALRSIARMPALAAVVVLSIGAGIGVNTATFSWLQAMVTRPIPGVRDASSYLLLEPRSEAGSYPGASWLAYRDLRERLRSFRDLVAFSPIPFDIGEPGHTDRSFGQLVSGNFFSALGLRPALGRFLRPDEAERPGSEPVVVVSYGYWQSKLGGSPSALGRVLRVNGQAVTVIGVTPDGFQGTVLGIDFDLWVPATMSPLMFGNPRVLDDRGTRGFSLMGQRANGVPRAAVQREVDVAMKELARLHPDTDGDVVGEVLPFWQAPRGPQRFLMRALATLQTVMMILLLAVCANTASLMLARATTRQREVGVRRALGAGRSRIVGLLLTENVLLSLLGAALGVAIAAWGTTALRAVPFPVGLPIRFQTQLDGWSLVFASSLGVACGLAFGLAPALQLSRIDPSAALRSGARSSGKSRLRDVLVAGEVALALLVLTAAALFFKNFRETREADPGFRREGVLLAGYDVGARQLGDAQDRELTARLLDRIRALPSVEGVAIATSVPLDIHGMPMRGFTIEGRARSTAGEDRALSNTVTPDYFRVMQIPLRAGRDFASLRDTVVAAQAIVNEEFVRRFVGNAEPLGRIITVREKPYAIVGVVRNSFYDSFGESPSPIIYFSYRDRTPARGELHVRTRAGSELLLSSALRKAVLEVDPQLALFNLRTLVTHVETNLVFRRIPARIFAVLGPLLLLLASIGIYAVVAYGVARRRSEIGVRLALGATAPRVVRDIVRDTLKVVGYGVVVGSILVFLVSIHVLNGRPLGATVIVGVPLLLMIVAAIASWLPARRATLVDPTVALRQD